MDFSPAAFAAGLGVGLIVGLTGSGGGALLTPILILAMGANAKVAVTTDLVASLVMRPAAAVVHLKRSVVNWPIAKWLVVGSVPTAFASGAVSGAFIPAHSADTVLEPVIGALLIVSGAGAVARRFARRATSERAVGAGRTVVARPLVTVAIGVFGGIAVGVTSVGSGTLILVALAFVYPGLTAYELVGTDLVQAVPLVLAAAAGHLVVGGVHVPLTFSVVLGGLPGALFGAWVTKFLSARNLGVIVAGVIFASGCALIGWVPGLIVGACAALIVSVALVITRRRTARLGVTTTPEELTTPADILARSP
ncbi:MAG: sulfite exporter TauE/SafE family protein [Acidimicrobiales bacterium]